MLWQTKYEKNTEKNVDFADFLTETALFYEKRFNGDGEFLELACRLLALPKHKRNERYAKKAFKNARVALQKRADRVRKHETQFCEAIATKRETAPEWFTAEIRVDIAAAYRLLTDYERMLLEMRHIAGFSCVEISEKIGVSRQAISRRLKFIVDKLKHGV